VCGYLLFVAYNGSPVGKAPVVRLWSCTILQGSSLMERKLMIDKCQKEGERSGGSNLYPDGKV
jgi:hypothetical protein